MENSEKREKKRPRLLKMKKKWVAAAAVVFVAAACFTVYSASKKDAPAAASYKNEEVARRDITVELTGSGTLQPADSYSVTALVKGEILDAPFEEGDVIEKDALLFQIDTTDMLYSIEKQQLSVEKAEMSYEDVLKSLENLEIRATESGTLTALYVEKGQTVQAGAKIAEIKNPNEMKLQLPFNSADAANIRVGDEAVVTLEGSFETLSGRVEKISNSDTVLPGNRLVRNVTILVSNPGALSDASLASATVGAIACNESGSFEYSLQKTILAKTSGEVKSILKDEGERVSSGEILVVLESTNSDTQLKSSEMNVTDAKLALKNTYDQLENYAIKSPIAGTIIEKSFKKGDKIDSSSGTKTMAVIYDMSSLTFDMNIDELDIGKVRVGQKVAITADAFEEKSFEGVVRKVSVSGTSSNGVTAYPATVVIEKPGELLPGMNVTAKILVESAENALSVPVSAVSRGNTVLVSKESETAKAFLSQQPSAVGNPSGEGGGKERQVIFGGQAPEGFVRVPVTLGVNDKDYIEILSGLAEGDVIAVPEVQASENKSAQNLTAGGPIGGGPMGGGVVVTTGPGGGNMVRRGG